MTLCVAIAHRRGTFALDVAFEAQTPGVATLFGASGSGKSTVIAAIAGLLRADSAQIWLDGEALHAQPPQARRIGVVFQDALLFPHMSVGANLRYGQRRAPPGRIGFDDTVALLGIGGLLDRRPATLSGGERQRVGIGRAMLSQPRLLLMDEPLSALDQPRRADILPYLARLRTALRIPIIYASHAMDEILALADTLVLLDQGLVRAHGPLATLAARVDLPLAMRADAAGVLHGIVDAHDAGRGLTAIAAGPQRFLVPLLDAPVGAAVRLLVPAREVILARDAPGLISVNNVFPAWVQSMAECAPGQAAVAIDGGAGPLLARVTLDAARRLDLRPGERVLALVKSMSVDVLTG